MKERNHTLHAGELHQFTGTENLYRHGLVPSIAYTDGVRYVAERAGAYWLLDEIALAQAYDKLVATQPFQLWTLDVDLLKHAADLRCEDGNGRILRKSAIGFTDFPLATISFYVAERIILLPSEY
jgi:hypothetical protein